MNTIQKEKLVEELSVKKAVDMDVIWTIVNKKRHSIYIANKPYFISLNKYYDEFGIANGLEMRNFSDEHNIGLKTVRNFFEQKRQAVTPHQGTVNSQNLNAVTSPVKTQNARLYTKPCLKITRKRYLRASKKLIGEKFNVSYSYKFG